MQHFTLQGCSNCDSLKEMYNKIECTIIDMGIRKWTNAQYNTSLSFDQELFNDLVRYKRVIGHRMYNPTYPSTAIDVQDLISQALRRAYKSDGCSQCVTCFESESTTSTTTSSSTTTIIE